MWGRAERAGEKGACWSWLSPQGGTQHRPVAPRGGTAPAADGGGAGRQASTLHPVARAGTGPRSKYSVAAGGPLSATSAHPPRGVTGPRAGGIGASALYAHGSGAAGPGPAPLATGSLHHAAGHGHGYGHAPPPLAVPPPPPPPLVLPPPLAATGVGTSTAARAALAVAAAVAAADAGVDSGASYPALAWLTDKDEQELRMMRGQSSSWFFIERLAIGALSVNITLALSSNIDVGAGQRPDKDSKRHHGGKVSGGSSSIRLAPGGFVCAVAAEREGPGSRLEELCVFVCCARAIRCAGPAHHPQGRHHAAVGLDGLPAHQRDQRARGAAQQGLELAAHQPGKQPLASSRAGLQHRQQSSSARRSHRQHQWHHQLSRAMEFRERRWAW